MERTEPRIAQNRTLSEHSAGLSRDELVRRIAAGLQHDEERIERLSASLHGARFGTSTGLRRLTSDALLDGFSSVGELLPEAIMPSALRLRPGTIEEYWRRVGGYLSESVEKVRSDR